MTNISIRRLAPGKEGTIQLTVKECDNPEDGEIGLDTPIVHFLNSSLIETEVGLAHYHVLRKQCRSPI